MITFKKDYNPTDLVRLFEPGCAKWIELTTNQHGEPCARFHSSKENSTAMPASEVNGWLLDRHNIDWHDVAVYPADTIGTSIAAEPETAPKLR